MISAHSSARFPVVARSAKNRDLGASAQLAALRSRLAPRLKAGAASGKRGSSQFAKWER